MNESVRTFATIIPANINGLSELYHTIGLIIHSTMISVTDSSEKPAPKKSMDELSKDLSLCYLQSSMFTVVGVAVGSALSMQKKNVRYLAVGAFFGTVSDAAYGFGYACRELQNDYQTARNAIYIQSKAEERRQAEALAVIAREKMPPQLTRQQYIEYKKNIDLEIAANKKEAESKGSSIQTEIPKWKGSGKDSGSNS